MTSGSHHMFVFLGGDGNDGELEQCGGLEFGPNIHSTQRSQEVFEYPEGIGRFVSAAQGFRTQIHFLNPSTETVHVEIAATLHAAPAEEVPTLASQVFINTFGIYVEPHSAGTTKQSCSVPKDVDLLTASSHMHRAGVYFTARDTEGQLLYETNEWAEPDPWLFQPTRKLKAGTTISIECQYQNDTDYTLSFGESALDNEMCIFTGVYYPAAPGESIVCLF